MIPPAVGQVIDNLILPDIAARGITAVFAAQARQQTVEARAIAAPIVKTANLGWKDRLRRRQIRNAEDGAVIEATDNQLVDQA